jgi:hypothetical protein
LLITHVWPFLFIYIEKHLSTRQHKWRSFVLAGALCSLMLTGARPTALYMFLLAGANYAHWHTNFDVSAQIVYGLVLYIGFHHSVNSRFFRTRSRLQRLHVSRHLLVVVPVELIKLFLIRSQCSAMFFDGSVCTM